MHSTRAPSTPTDGSHRPPSRPRRECRSARRPDRPGASAPLYAQVCPVATTCPARSAEAAPVEMVGQDRRGPPATEPSNGRAAPEPVAAVSPLTVSSVRTPARLSALKYLAARRCPSTTPPAHSASLKRPSLLCTAADTSSVARRPQHSMQRTTDSTLAHASAGSAAAVGARRQVVRHHDGKLRLDLEEVDRRMRRGCLCLHRLRVLAGRPAASTIKFENNGP